jgi:hypothetical protein
MTTFLSLPRELQAAGLSIDSFHFSFWWDWLEFRALCACKVGALSLETHLQSALVWLFWRWHLVKHLPRLASNHNHRPHLRLSSS